MNGLVIVLIGIVVLAAGYLLYGRWLAKKWGIDPNAKTPAYTHEGGMGEIDLLIDLSAFTIHYSITAFSLKYAFIASNIFPAASICSAASSFDAI
jgi:hypothetical protein